MDLNQLKRDLFDTTFLVGGFRQRRALKALAECPDVRAVDVLAEALLKGHSRSESIRNLLLAWKSPGDQAKIDRLWKLWWDNRQPNLLSVLCQLGHAASDPSLRLASNWKLGRVSPIENTAVAVRQALSLLQDGDPVVRGRVIPALAQLPNAASLNQEIVGWWLEHPSPELEAFIVAHRRVPEQDMVDALWLRWLKDRQPTVGKVLVQLGVPAAMQDVQLPSMLKLGRAVELKPDQRSVRMAMGWVRDADPDIRRGFVKTLEQLPNDDQLNSEIVEAWAKHESSELEALIQKQGRKPARPELEALFYLVTGQAKAYQALQDDRGEYFLQAFLMASATFRQRINDTVVRSGNARLVEIYSKAMGGRDGFDRGLYLEALKKAGDEDQLFESLRDMKLVESLEYCQRWAETGQLPKHDRRRQAAERAAAAYRGLGQIAIEQGPAPPSGLCDLFAAWKQATVSEAQRRDDARAADPLRRARALYLGQGSAGASQPVAPPAADSDDWPVRLVARLQAPALAAREDHVQWIGALSGIDAAVLQASVAGTPVEYKRFSDQLAQARRGGPAAGRGARLLEILCALQGAFVATDGDWGEDTREATDQRAIDVGEDAPLD